METRKPFGSNFSGREGADNNERREGEVKRKRQRISISRDSKGERVPIETNTREAYSTSDRDGYRERQHSNREYDGERRPRFNRDNDGERRSYNRDNGGERRPLFGRDNNGERRRPNNRDNNGGRNPRFNKNNDGKQHAHYKGYSKKGSSWRNSSITKELFGKTASTLELPTESSASANPSTKMRLNRYIAISGICSRREADEKIKQGLVKLNGKVITEMGITVEKGDVVEYDGKVITAEKKVYVLLNKPKDTVTTTDDPEDRRTVMDLVSEACEERIYPVGRLDRNTTGVLLLTNDGEIAEKLIHPRYDVRKIYHVYLDRSINEKDMIQMADGLTLEDGPITVDDVRYVDHSDKRQVGVQIHSGRNRIVRRIFEHLGYKVIKLDRVYFAGLTKISLPRGTWRHLTDTEINKLKAGFFK